MGKDDSATARIRVRQPSNATRALFAACDSLDPCKVASALLAGAVVDTRLRGQTPLLAVVKAWCRGGRDVDLRATAILGDMAAHGLDMDWSQPPYAPALSHLVSDKDQSARRHLLAMGASANATDCDGVSVLHAATAALCAEAICDLLAAGAHVNAHDALGRSPLHYLVCGRVDVGAGSGEDARRCIRALVEGGASLSFRATSAPCPGPPYEPGAALLETVLAEMDREHLDTSLAGECSPWSLRPARL